MNRYLKLFTAVVMTAFLALPAVSGAETEVQIGGRELSPGVSVGDVVYGVLGAGWCVDPESVDEYGWAPITESNGGQWVATVRRVGEAAFGSTATIVGGYYSLQLPDGKTLAGRFRDGGLVEWPPDEEQSLGCGPGVAVVDAELTLSLPWGLPWRTAGRFEGCLDDQEWLEESDALRLPPRIFGTMIFKK